VDQVVFKNKTVPVGIYALAGDAALGRSAEFAEFAERHAQMMALYRARDFAGAGEFAQTLAPLAPAPVRGLYAFQMRRFAALAASEPPPAWSAVLALEEK
jgi:adenylate cyclase